MAEKRDPPAYQEYAAATLAKLPFRVMSLQDRGLLYTMRLECWVNNRLPSDPNTLALMLGVPLALVEESLPAVMPFLAISEGSIICPELENYRQELADRRKKQSSGGKEGASITNKKRGASSTPPGNPTSKSRAPRRVRSESLVQTRPDQNSQNQSNHGEDDTAQWLEEYGVACNGIGQYAEDF